MRDWMLMSIDDCVMLAVLNRATITQDSNLMLEIMHIIFPARNALYFLLRFIKSKGILDYGESAAVAQGCRVTWSYTLSSTLSTN